APAAAAVVQRLAEAPGVAPAATTTAQAPPPHVLPLVGRRPLVEPRPPAGGPPVEASPGPAVQRLVAPAGPIERPPAIAARAAVAAGAAAPGGQSDRELDELARKLYDRFRVRLRSELLVERERAGLTTDLR